MSKLLKKKGVWLFFAATVLFFGGQTYLGARAAKSPPSADRVQGIDAKGIHAIRVERNDGAKPGNLSYRELGIRIVEPATDVAVKFDADSYVLKSRIEGDVLVVTLDAQYVDGIPKNRQESFGQGDEILVPSSIQKLEFSSTGRVKISAETPSDLEALDVRFADCPRDVNFENMAVTKMTVAKRCQPGAQNSDGGGMRFSHVKLGSLEITSTIGHIYFGDLVKAEALQLNLGDDVEISAQGALLRNARFGAVSH